MMMLSPSAAVKDPDTGRDGGGIVPPSGGGGDDSRGGDGSPDYGQKLLRARAGLAFVIAPISAMFVVLTAVYVARQRTMAADPYSHLYSRHWIHVDLPLGQLLLNTVVLLLSSFTMEMARRQLKREVALAPVRAIPGVSLGDEFRMPWLGLTVVLGLGFLAGQFLAWHVLASRGFVMADSTSSSFVYILTAGHAMHLAAGLLVLLYAQAIVFLHKPLELRHIVVDVTAWYWHFMALLWIYVFALLKFVP
jgi:cytochrome c oxidase subunit III